MDPSEPGSFPTSYDESRAWFQGQLGPVQERWPGAGLERRQLDDGLAVEWIAAPPRERRERVLVLTAGEHGIEGYVGAAVRRLFLDQFLGHLDPDTTGLVLVHAINPWGMAHRRRTNLANVDLNRNFVLDDKGFDPAINLEYDGIHPFLNPERPVGPPLGARLAFAAGLVRHLLAPGPAAIRRATLLGQYRHTRGVYFGGSSLQPETQIMMELYRQCLAAFPHLVLLDMHTGYGPRSQMSIVCSPQEPAAPDALARRFRYPRVVQAGSDQFYAMQGEMIDCLYRLAAEIPGRRIFAASFEFGTLGDSLLAAIRSLRASVWENQAHWHGTAAGMAATVAREFEALFYPGDPAWRAKALADAQQALSGILRAEGFVGALPAGH
jgi:predicted deacylase